MAKGKDCVITVWLALSLAVITGLFLLLLESARTAGTEVYLDLAVRSAADSLFADYHRELWERYHVFGLEEYADEEIRQEFYAYMEPYQDTRKNRSWVGIAVSPEDIRLTETKSLLSDNGEPLREEILTYMRFARIPEEEVSNGAEELLGKADAERLSGDVSEWIGKMNESATGLAEYSARICREAELLRKKKTALVRAAKNGDGPGFSEISAGMRGSADLIRSLAGGCRKMSERYDDETADHRKDAGDTGELREKLDTLTRSADRLLRDLSAAEELSEAAQREEDSEDDADAARKEEIWAETADAAEALPVPEEFWSVRNGDPEKLAAIRNAGAILSGRLLDVVLPEGKDVSEKKITVPEAPSGTIRAAGSSGGFSLADRLLLSEYVLRTAEYYERGASEQELQAEYAAYGRESDRENLSAAVSEGIAIRTGEGLIALMADQKKRKEAEALSAAVTGGMPGAMEAMTFFLLLLWAAWQAAADAKTLLSGEKVPAFRSANQFTVTLQGILSGDLSQKGKEDGISSRDCLRLLLAMHMDDACVLRMADVMQHVLGKEQEDFRMRRMVSELTAVVSARSAHLFSVGSQYGTETTVTRAY